MEEQAHSQGAQNIRVNHKESLVREAMRQMIDQLNALKAGSPRRQPR